MAGFSRGLRANAFGSLKVGTSTSTGASGNNIGAPVFVLACQTTAAVDTYTVVKDSPVQFRVLDAWIVCTAANAAADTFTVYRNSDAITDAIDPADSTDKDLQTAGTIDDAYHVIRKGDDLKVVTASGAVGLVYILCAKDES